MAEGRLQIITVEEGTYIPVTNAAVRISKDGETLYDTYTDSSGQTEFISLEAPPVSYTQQPGEPQPYTSYDVNVTADGYKDVTIRGVQVYGDAEAIQNISMQRGEGSVEISVPSPTLYGDYPSKISEDEVQEVNEQSGFSVLDRVVIPEYIIVHDGRPNSSAENYYVPYKEYIKNVASGEIYSTWNKEAILANLYAIQSFTLNRVFTEHYRNRGYDFTITSSTAYDQDFSYGRTTYEEINELVDEIFDEYILREGQTQPLFAQYCDGERVTCPNWLSQWGSEYLAGQGYSAIDILKYYYGDNISIEQAEKVSGIPVSFSGNPLYVGSTGEEVRRVQQQLNVVAATYSAIPKIKVDGVYGTATEEAVKKFQKIFNLPQTGVVDKATYYQISQIYVALEKLSELS
jgi:hypothetical protein